MKKVEEVSADPYVYGSPNATPCFACYRCHPQKPTKKVSLSDSKLRLYAAVDTSDICNPFLKLKNDVSRTIWLCIPCRDRRLGWDVISNGRRYGRNNALRSLQAWRARCAPARDRSQLKICHICSSVGSEKTIQNKIYKNPSCDWTLYNLISREDSLLNQAFITEFCRRASCDSHAVQTLLQDPSRYYLCYIHINHSRYSQTAALEEIEEQRCRARTRCIFLKKGCTRHMSGKQRLWRVPTIDRENLDTLESFAQLEETVCSHSGGDFHARDVMGKYCCRSCLYIIMEGKGGSPSIVAPKSLPLQIDRSLVRCVLFALDNLDVAKESPIFTDSDTQGIGSIGRMLRSSCILQMGNEEHSIRMLPFQEVVRVRKRLREPPLCTISSKPLDIDDRALQKRIEPALAQKGIILKKMSYRLRCYIHVGQVDRLLSDIATAHSRTIDGKARPSIEKIRSHYDTVARHFEDRKDHFWAGSWSLTKEVASIPGELWRDVMLTMVSDSRLRAWRVAARALRKNVYDMFPLSNSPDCLPEPSIEEELHNGTQYSRADLLFCVRVLKVIEQTVLSRTKGIAGPLTITISVSGICEVTPSFVSVLNAMGVCLSYTTTERFRQRLIAERERNGPWQHTTLDEVVMPVLQFDNWDIKPLHAVKVDGKPMPKINGSLLQGVVSGQKRRREETVLNSSKRPRMHSWKSVHGLGSREEFINRLSSVENTVLKQQFSDIAFGLTALFRGQLVGGKGANDSEYNSNTIPDMNFGVRGDPLNFRTLLLSTFKPHGGRDLSDESLYDEQVVYVEISRDSAADVITVRRFINLVEEQICPGRPGRPKFVVLGGDQPSYKMFCELWLDSWRESRHERDAESGAGQSSNRKPPLHEWFIPFPGFFHAEKQIMYSLSKEMLDGLGLEELAACAGLSPSHVSNIVSHSHARNNRAVLFNLACAIIIHLIDMSVAEDVSIREKVIDLHRVSSQKRVSTDGSKLVNASSRAALPVGEEVPTGALFSETSDIVTAEVISVGKILREHAQKTFNCGTNGKHFVQTVLFSCLLPTVGFHVLSRTGHTNFTDAFWFNHNAILHSTTHLKYQEVSLFYAFFRGIIPSAVEQQMYYSKPGRMVSKLLSFTGRGKEALDIWGFSYVHLDELLEMLIVRHLKSLSVNLLGHLENSASWLMQVSMFRALARYMTGASRAYGRKREANDGGDMPGPLATFDRNACQWRTVSRMLHVMGDVGFLNV